MQTQNKLLMACRGLIGQRACGVSVAALVLLTGGAQHARAAAIPYPNPGTYNSITYTFTAAASGDIMAYFTGANAGDINTLGLLVNGVSTGVFGLNDHTSSIGDSLDLGHANAGDVLTFVLHNSTVGGYVYSDPSRNGSYDSSGTLHNHVYSAPYTGSPNYPGVPNGTYVGFEDQQFPIRNSDLDYNDETFVFTDVSLTTTTVPDAASSLSLLSIGLAGLGVLRRRWRS